MKNPFLIIIIILFGVIKTVIAVPADGSYECNIPPEKAKPAWEGGSPFSRDKTPSALEWIEVKNGAYEKKPGAPKCVAMHVNKFPVKGKFYTIEFRFKIIDPKGEKAYPLRLVFSRKGSCYTWFDFNWLKSKPQMSFTSIFPQKVEFSKIVKDESLINGWQVVRQTVEYKGGKLEVKIYLNKKEIQSFTTDNHSTYSDFIFLQSYGNHILWSLDYIRWANKVVPINENLEAPLNEADKKAKTEKEAKNKLDSLVN